MVRDPVAGTFALVDIRTDSSMIRTRPPPKLLPEKFFARRPCCLLLVLVPHGFLLANATFSSSVVEPRKLAGAVRAEMVCAVGQANLSCWRGAAVVASEAFPAHGDRGS